MEFFALNAAVLVVLGAPALAAVYWRRCGESPTDSIELVAVAYGGIAVATLSLWSVSRLLGASWHVVSLSSLAGAAVLVVAAGVRQKKRPRGAWRALAKTAHFPLLGVAGAVFAALAYVPFLTYGWERADGVHRMAMTDWYKHLVTTTALSASDVFPPANPFLHVADAAPYYYGFHLVGASTARLSAVLSGADAPGHWVYPALLLLTLWTAAATPFVCYTVARTVASGNGGSPADNARVPLLAALGGTFLAGFDLIPLAIDTAMNVATGGIGGGGIAGLRGAIPSTHLDYWIHHSERQFNAPYLTTLWAPQHMAAVLVALLAVHLVLQRRLFSRHRGEATTFAAGWLLPALLLAGLPALSAYVAIGVAAGVGGATLIECLRERRLPWHTESWGTWLLPAALAAVLALPVAAVLGSGAGPGFTVHVSDAGGWVNGAVWSSLFGAHWLTGLADTLAVYLVELGILGLLALFEIRRLAVEKRLRPHQQHVVAIVVALLIFIALVRPPVGGPNNLYARPLVFAWFLLSPFAALRFARIGVGNPRWTMAAIVLCLLANGYALLGVVLEGAMFWATPASTVDAVRWINDNAPADAVVAIPPDDFASGFGYRLRRSLAIADERHALLFGASATEYERVAVALRQGVAAGGDQLAIAADAAAATLLVLPRGSAAAARPSRCFERVHANADWLVLRRTQESCTGER